VIGSEQAPRQAPVGARRGVPRLGRSWSARSRAVLEEKHPRYLQKIDVQRMAHGSSTIRPVVVRGSSVLLGCGAVDCEIQDSLALAAKEEITSRRSEFAKQGVAWGYLLGVERESTPDRYPSAWLLCEALEVGVARTVGQPYGALFDFSFCKAYSGPVITEAAGVHYEGLHIDTHPALTETTDLLRILINVDTSPRRFKFGDITRMELASSGLYTDRTSFHAAHVEEHVRLRDVLIPGRKGGRVSFLVFWASVIPHVGVTEPNGYFLYSFEAVVASPETPEGMRCAADRQKAT
jgi:hypothetical protein